MKKRKDMPYTLKFHNKSETGECMKSFRIIKSSLSLIVFTILVVVLAILNGCKSSKSDQPDGPDGTGETFRFVFMADSRGDTLKHPVNSDVLNAIISSIDTLSPQPSFLMFGGDMAYRGRIDCVYTFQPWKDLFNSLTGKGIPLYTTVGNHELYNQHSSYGFILANQQDFQSAFSDNPVNGPAGYEHLTYSFTSPGGNSFFAVLDPYYLKHDTIPKGLGGHIDSVQMAWLQAQVAQTAATHKFLFIHTPYYYVSDDPEEPSSADTSFTKLWAFLDDNNFDFYACGHSHLFSRKTIDYSVTPTPQTLPPTPSWKNNVVQLLNGTCGAGPSTGNIDPAIKTAWNVHNDAKTYYFSVIDISGNTVTVNSYGGYTGAYILIDTFVITK